MFIYWYVQSCLNPHPRQPQNLAKILPSRNEGCPNVVLEALACGTPVVASRVGAVPDLLDDDCGIMVRIGDAAGLAEALETALNKEWDRAALRRRVADMSWDQNAQKLYDILRSVVGRLDGESAGR